MDNQYIINPLSLHTILNFSFFFCYISLRFVSIGFVSFRSVSFRFVWFRFVSFRYISLRFVSFGFVSFCLISFRFVRFCFVSFHFYFVSHITGTLKKHINIECRIKKTRSNTMSHQNSYEIVEYIWNCSTCVFPFMWSLPKIVCVCDKKCFFILLLWKLSWSGEKITIPYILELNCCPLKLENWENIVCVCDIAAYTTKTWTRYQIVVLNLPPKKLKCRA